MLQLTDTFPQSARRFLQGMPTFCVPKKSNDPLDISQSEQILMVSHFNY